MHVIWLVFGLTASDSEPGYDHLLNKIENDDIISNINYFYRQLGLIGEDKESINNYIKNILKILEELEIELWNNPF